MKIRTRFAPSPTGYLHVGGARTALFSWLLARKAGGQFVLRIEDTDRERSTQAAVDAILQGMDWLGLDYDEGPFYQTDRYDRYNEVIQELLEDGHAYYCNCSKELLAQMREQQMQAGVKPRYDRRCRDLNIKPDQSGDCVVRFKTPLGGSVIFNDLIRGHIEIKNTELDDLIIARSDGSPTYNLTVAVDDNDMAISHVVRGEDHISNTPKQIHLLNAIGAQIPQYAHVPMILGEDGKRLSKRHGAVSVLQYREEGYLAEALINYLVRLGWSAGDKEIFSRNEMIDLFEIENVNKAGSIFNPEKLLWLNQLYIKEGDEQFLANELQTHFTAMGVDTSEGPALAKVIAAYREREKTLKDIAQSSVYLFQEIGVYDEKAVKKCFGEKALQPLQTISSAFTELEDEMWTSENIKQTILQTAETLNVGMGKIGQPLRVALTGGSSSPSIEITIFLVGRKRTLQRIADAIAMIQTQNSP